MSRKNSEPNPYGVIDDPSVRLDVYKNEGKKVAAKERAKWWLERLRADPEVKKMVSK